jgi:hypothetical protein
MDDTRDCRLCASAPGHKKGACRELGELRNLPPDPVAETVRAESGSARRASASSSAALELQRMLGMFWPLCRGEPI